MEKQKYCNPCAPIAKAEITTHTDKGEAKEPINIAINGDYFLYGALIWLLYKLLNGLRRTKPRQTVQLQSGSSFDDMFVQRFRYDDTHDKKYCASPSSKREPLVLSENTKGQWMPKK